MIRPVLFHAVTWLVALGLVGWTLGQLPLEAIAAAVVSLTAGQWAVWIGLNAVIIALFVLRWAMLLRAQRETPGFMALLLIRQAGQAVSFITPGPQFGGEPLQVYWLWKRCGLPGHKALLSVGLDRFFELWVNFAVLLLAVLLLGFSGLAPADWGNLAGVLLLALAVLSLLGRYPLRHPDRIGVWVGRLAARWRHHPYLGRLDAHWQSLSDHLQAIVTGQRPRLLLALCLSGLGWLGMLLELWLLLDFVGIAPSFADYLLILVAMRLAFLLPLPGGLGTLEAALLWAFQGAGLPLAAAAGVIALMRLRDAVILTAGVVALRGLGGRPAEGRSLT